MTPVTFRILVTTSNGNTTLVKSDLTATTPEEADALHAILLANPYRNITTNQAQTAQFSIQAFDYKGTSAYLFIRNDIRSDT